MNKQRFTEEQIIAMLKEQEAGAKAADLCRTQLIARHKSELLNGFEPAIVSKILDNVRYDELPLERRLPVMIDILARQ